MLMLSDPFVSITSEIRNVSQILFSLTINTQTPWDVIVDIIKSYNVMQFSQLHVLNNLHLISAYLLSDNDKHKTLNLYDPVLRKKLLNYTAVLSFIYNLGFIIDPQSNKEKLIYNSNDKKVIESCIKSISYHCHALELHIINKQFAPDSVSIINNDPTSDGLTIPPNLPGTNSPANDWDCNLCLYRNPSSNLKCAMCDTAKSQNSHAIPPLAPSPSWRCHACTFQNKSSAITCEVCNASKNGLPQQDSQVVLPPISFPNQSWTCSLCTLPNMPSAVICAVCNTARNPGSTPAQSWICQSCHHNNTSVSRSLCNACGVDCRYVISSNYVISGIHDNI